MKVELKGVGKIGITGEYIRLDALLKFASFVSTGGEAKILIQNGEVFVGGNPCTMRGRKIKPGEVVRLGGQTIVVAAKGGSQQAPAGEISASGDPQ